jgi:hypothetical protein
VVQGAGGQQRGVAPVEAHHPGRAVVALQHPQAPPRRAACDLHRVVATAQAVRQFCNPMVCGDLSGCDDSCCLSPSASWAEAGASAENISAADQSQAVGQETHWEEASRRPSCEKSRSMVERGEGVRGQ